MSRSTLDKIDFYYLVMLLIKKINLKKKRKQEKQNNLLYTVSNLIKLAPRLGTRLKKSSCSIRKASCSYINE
jgi:hypothetical protein